MLIDKHPIGAGHPCFIIAEAGVNHNGDPELAHKLIEAAQAAGASAIKFQTFNADALASPDAPKAAYQIETTGQTETQVEMLRRLEISPSVLADLRDDANARHLVFLSSPFDEPSVTELVDLGVPALKIPSGEITNLPFLRHVARQGKPIILSTGMATLAEVETAIRTIEGAGNPPLALLHCVSSYPALPTEMNLRVMHTLSVAFGLPVGLSDHTLGLEVALAAVALGACIIEKHLTLEVALPGPDHRASLEPGDMARLVTGIRVVEAALGDGQKRPSASEMETAVVARKSLVAAQDVAENTVLTAEYIAIRRPGTGLSPQILDLLVGRVTRRPLRAGQLITLDDLQ